MYIRGSLSQPAPNVSILVFHMKNCLKSLAVLSVSLSFAMPAFAQEAGGGTNLLSALALPLLLLLIFYFLLIRPQQRRQKQHREMVESVKRGDTVVSSGGLIGKVTKVADNELHVEIAENVRVKIVRGMVADVRAKGQPVEDKK